MKHPFRFRPVGAVLIAGLLASVIGHPALAADPSPAAAATYDKLIAEYMAGNWDDLEVDLKANLRQLNSLPAAQKQNLNYIAQTLAESHPVWWHGCKSGKQTLLKESIFGVPIDAVYDPEQKQSTNIKVTGSIREITLGWPAGEMDNAAQAEHGFTKGELNGYVVWSTLGMTAVYLTIPFESMVNLSQADNLKLTRVLDFRGNVAAAYYANPRSRQWALFLSMHYYQLKYHKSPNVMSRKALGAMFAAEVLAHRSEYPSVPFPDTIAPDNAEETLVTGFHKWIEKHQWTFAEDKLMRDALRTFALANNSVIRTGGPVKLANGLEVALDADADAAPRAKRDQWLAQKLVAGPAPAGPSVNHTAKK